jgi:maleamate amidohydrolase
MMEDHNVETDNELLYGGKGFGLTMGYGQRPGIVVIDIIRAFTDYTNPKMLLATNLEKQMKEIKRILTVARARKIPIFFTTVAYDDDDLKDAGLWALKHKGSRTLRVGTPEVEIDPTLEFQKGEMLLTKKYASAFFGTDLVSRLTTQSIDTLIITGSTTSGCVRATAVDGISYGFRPIIAREAVGDRSKEAHEQSLIDLQAKYADVVSTEEVLHYLQHVQLS